MAKKIWKFFCSVKLTIILFVLILIPSIIGMLIQQNAPDPSKYVETYGAVWNTIFRYLGFYDIYHDPRFIILLAALGMNTFACTVNRLKMKWTLLGTMLTHFGLLLILLGALAGAILGVKGFMFIHEGETTDKMNIGQATDETEALPFHVKLVDFILDKYEKPAERLIVYDVKANKEKSHKITEGQNVPLSAAGSGKMASLFGAKPKTGDSIAIKKVLPNAVIVPSLSEGPEQTGAAAMTFHIAKGGREVEGYTGTQIERPLLLDGGRAGIGYSEISSANQIDERIRQAISLSSKASSQVEVALPGKGVKTYPAEVGSKFKVEGTDYIVEVMKYVSDFVRDETGTVFSRSDLPRNPAIQVSITGPAGAKEQWIFANYPTMHATGELPFDIKFKRNELASAIADYILVLNLSGGKPVLAHMRQGKLASRKEIELGEKVHIEGTDYTIAIDKFFKNANIVRQIANRPDLSNEAAVEAVLQLHGESEPLYLWEKNQVDVEGYKMVYLREERIKDFYSILQVIDGGKVVAEKKIEVNDPIRYKGYSLYQASYDSEGLTWSGLQVKKDPGVPLVYAGFLVQIVGMIIIFYINPLIKKARKA
ncbi:MAG: cytochrome c biogenesis protein ResB [Candidatus Lindowbacteria bacterium]|nr:cytochrome c biogenesis protein ResB [Candidatus Lindowbacteria bacterium]